MKKLLGKFLLGFSIGGFFLYMAMRQINFADCWEYVKNAHYLYIVGALFVYVLAFFVRSIRWHIILAPLVKIQPRKLFSFLILGFFMNNLLPLRIGEIVRSHISGMRFGKSRSSILGTVVVERFFDSLTFLFLFLITILFLPFPEWIKHTFQLGSVIFIGGFIALVIISHNHERTVRFLHSFDVQNKIIHKIRSFILNFISGLAILKNYRDLFSVAILSLVVWTIEGIVFLIVAHAFDLQLNLLQCFLVMAVIATGSVLPTAPGYVGTVEFLGVATLGFLGYEKNAAFAFIATLHAAQLFTIYALGIRSIIVEKISFKDLLSFNKKTEGSS